MDQEKKEILKISIITPVYNSGTLIQELAESLKAQDLSEGTMEWIVVDDGSGQETQAILKKMEEEISWMLLFFQPENRGACAARNRGLREASGEWVKFMDADDLISPNMLQLQRQSIIENKADVVISPMVRRDERGGQVKEGKPKWLVDGDQEMLHYLRASWFHHSSCLFRREDVLKMGGWNEALHADQDGDFLYRFWLLEPKVSIENGSLFYYRNHERTPRITQGINAQKIESRLRVCQDILSHPGNYPIVSLKRALAYKMNQIAYMALADSELFKRVEEEYRKLLGAPGQYGSPFEKVGINLLGFRKWLMIKQQVVRIMRTFRLLPGR